MKTKYVLGTTGAFAVILLFVGGLGCGQKKSEVLIPPPDTTQAKQTPPPDTTAHQTDPDPVDSTADDQPDQVDPNAVPQEIADLFTVTRVTLKKNAKGGVDTLKERTLRDDPESKKAYHAYLMKNCEGHTRGTQKVTKSPPKWTRIDKWN